MSQLDNRGPPIGRHEKIEQAFEEASLDIIEKCVKDGIVLGLGSGSTVARFARVLGKILREKSLEIKVVASSMQSWLLAQENSLSTNCDYSHCPPVIDLAVDGADQVDFLRRATIKGGGGALLREKIILSSSKEAFIIGDSTKFVSKLSRSVPIEVVQFAFESAESRLSKDFGARVELRKLEKGYPYYSESGNLILDCEFQSGFDNPALMERELKLIPGVVEVGIFNNKVEGFYKIKAEGAFERL